MLSMSAGKIARRMGYIDRAQLIARLLREMRKEGEFVGVEIGVWKGDMIFSLLKEESRITKLYAIDPYRVFLAQWTKWGEKEWDATYVKVCKKLAVFGDRVTMIRAKSEECVGLIPLVDFIELDGLHSYDQIMTELELYEGKVVNGGFVCGHDFFGRTGHTRDVKVAVSDYAEKYGRELMTEKGNVDMWWWRR